MGATNRYAWAPVGQKSFGYETHGAWKTVTMIGAIGLDGFRGFCNIESGTSVDVFYAFVKSELLPNLKPGDIVLMDNLSAHKNAKIVSTIQSVGATVKFLPPYSPDFNPIEKLWGKLKEFVRRQATDTRESFDDAVAAAMNLISQSDLLGWFQHCGYRVTKT